MTVPRWNAQEFHAKHRPAKRADSAGQPRRKPNWISIGIVGVLAVAAIATAIGVGGDQDKIGICHATGSEENPYVLIVTSRNGYEHGHHRHHANDYFLDDWSMGCGVDVIPADPDDGSAPGDEEGGYDAGPDDGADEAPEEDGSDADDGDTSEEEQSTDDQEEFPVDDTPVDEDTDSEQGDDAGTGGNETADGPGGNETADGPGAGDAAEEESDSGSDDGTDGNETAEEAPSPLGDVAVKQTASQDAFEVILTIVVSSVGAANATDVVLSDSLPDLRRSWFVGGADASDCVLTGLELSCWFGDLEPGEQRHLELRAFTDRMPCGFPVTNTAIVDSFEDAESRNNTSSASIAARAC
jgi:hypothetical protein